MRALFSTAFACEAELRRVPLGAFAFQSLHRPMFVESAFFCCHDGMVCVVADVEEMLPTVCFHFAFRYHILAYAIKLRILLRDSAYRSPPHLAVCSLSFRIASCLVTTVKVSNEAEKDD